MSGITRRRFIGGAAAVGAVAAAGISTVATAAEQVQESRRVVVIGSGFGGSVAALRLATAGVPVLLLERGIRWPTGPNADTFSRTFTPDSRCAWLSTSPTLSPLPPAIFAPYVGVIDRVRGNGLDIICGAGVGGGSLVYHGMTMQPSEAVFAQVLPQVDYGPLNRTYYPRVASMLRTATIPDDVLNSKQYLSNQIFINQIKSAGMTPERIPMPIDWSYARAELQGTMKPSYTNGDLIYGVNNDGKNSLDVTYLAAAEATGKLEIAIQHVVREIAMNPQGKWVVSADRIDVRGTVVGQRTITADAVFLGAGVAGTNRLLMRAKGKNTIPDLPDGLGAKVGNNGDRIFFWSSLLNTGAPQGGPACIGTKQWADPKTAHTIVHGPVPVPLESHMMTMIGYGVTPVRGAFQYDASKDNVVLNYPRDTEVELISAIKGSINKIIASAGGTLTDATAGDPSTYHPLGGAPIGSVCDQYGRVLGHRGLYVVDGSLIPGSTAAANPSMTIAALAERSLDTIVRTDVGSVF